MRFREALDKALYWLLVTLMAVMVVNVLWQVASRFVLKSPSSFTDELARFLLIWVSLLGASYVTGKKLHLAIDILPSKLQGKKQRNLNVLINLLVALFSVLVLVWGGIKLVYITLSLNQTSAALNVPLGYVYLALPLSGLIITYYSLTNLTEKREAPKEIGQELAQRPITEDELKDTERLHA
ncbi:TRAP-type C4-dicarboxylate transport system permease small subunit [Pontibacter ummariensis]|uniref:TRAP-type C4-dicarboxylate transport system, small permease component n=1 Tax=Pontibacter ummariensis TaxID=1610492 RepID=A0A239H4E9_9BACT|nr:TRAP transporter small permease [Pontibacter ummariensis]PRY10930.1 TRAP-type C4-dicarboxylate transport system permease small subunit [Pontibacter ummariensis]SNS75124.1 TRAP-type C4-dicarboxylate transport system, small permease component [Pontibacter ummariensis]